MDYTPVPATAGRSPTQPEDSVLPSQVSVSDIKKDTLRTEIQALSVSSSGSDEDKADEDVVMETLAGRIGMSLRSHVPLDSLLCDLEATPETLDIPIGSGVYFGKSVPLFTDYLFVCRHRKFSGSGM